jgi:hypothetical protein
MTFGSNSLSPGSYASSGSSSLNKNNNPFFVGNKKEEETKIQEELKKV